MKKISFLIIFAFVLTLALYAVHLGELQRQIDKSYSTLKTWQADLAQTNYFKQLNKKIIYHGKIYYRPEHLLIDFYRPHRQRLSIIDDDVELYDSKTNTLYKTKVLLDFGKMNPIDILRQYWKASEVSVIRHDSKTVSIRLLPKNDPWFKQLSARVRRTDGIVEQLSYQDSSGNTVTYDFTNIRINAAIPATVWEFLLPLDVQVIEH